MDNNPKYLRVSLTSGCNFFCGYCRPRGDKSLPPSVSSPVEKLKSTLSLFSSLGVTKIRFTGGEPTIYPRLIEIIRYARSLDSRVKLAMTTNGALLPRLAEPLHQAGLNSVNISLDTLDRTKFERIAGVDAFDKVIDGIHAACKHLQSVKLNCVVIKGSNDDEIEDIVRFADSNGVTVRFIEYMPSRFNNDRSRGYLSAEDMRKILPYDFSPVDDEPGAAARYYKAPGLNHRVGFISPVSHPFCDDCKRIRLAADGRIYGCLFSSRSANIFELIDKSEESAREAVMEAMLNKERIGCAVSSTGQDSYPSFVVMGG